MTILKSTPFKLFLKVLLIYHVMITQVFAESKQNLLGVLETKEPQSTSEYIFKTSSLDKLIGVELLGAIQKPGLYYVPADTDLIKLLSLAGGFSSETSTDSVILRREKTGISLTESDLKFAKEEGKSFKVNIESLIKDGSSSNLKLNNNDVIFVPKTEQWISNNTYRAITLTSVLLTAVLTGLLIESRMNQN